MSNTKQPPAELVEKMKEFTIPLPNKIQDYRDKTISEITTERAEQCAQIAVNHSEPFKEQFIKWMNLYNEQTEENRGLREFLKEFTSAIESEEIIIQENYDNDGWENCGGR